MERQHSFNTSVKVGQEGENIVYNYLYSLPNVERIEDVSLDSKYQQEDIDFIIYLKDNTQTSVEIKADTYDSGNIFFETISNEEARIKGCMYKTTADWLFYYFTTTKELYILNMPKYRQWFANNCNHFHHKRFSNINKKYNSTYHSCGYTIPKKYLEENFNPKYFKKKILDI